MRKVLAQHILPKVYSFTFTKETLQIRYAGSPSCCCITKQHFYNYLKNYEFL